MSTPATVTVRVWGEGPGERKNPGVLRVLVGGQAAGAVTRDGPVWSAEGYTARGLVQPRFSEHATAAEAVGAVLNCGWARKLGARAASPVHWSDKALRAVRRGGAR